MTLASIVIPSRGGAQRLPGLLSALAAQDDTEWEAIVVLDGDIDDSEAVVADYAHLPVRSIVFPENRGRVAALNAGFEAATGDVLIRCDDDLVPTPDYVRRFKQTVLAGKAAIGLYRNVLPNTPYAAAYGRDADQKFRAGAYAAGPSGAWRYWAGNCAISRDHWEQIGPYDPDYRAYGWEDVDYGYRLHEHGASVVLIPELETTHRVAAVTTKVRVQRAYHSGAARLTFEGKHPEATMAPAAPPADSVWNRAVLAVAKAPRKMLLQAAGAVDVLATVLPAAVSRKLIALLVEASGVSGYRRPHDTTTEF